MPLPNPSDSELPNGGADADAPITVDLKESDLKKAITRSDPDDVVDKQEPERVLKSHAARTNDFGKRLGRIQRQFNQSLAEQEARFQRELRSRDERIEALSTRRVDSRVDTDELAHEKLMAELEAAYADAMEKGESVKCAQLQRRMATEASRYASAQTAKQMGEAYERDQATRRSKQTGDDAESRVAGPTRLGKRFMNANADWWDDPDFTIEQLAAKKIDSDLIADGYDPNTEEHYEELQARLQEKFPDLEVSLPSERRSRREAEDEDEIEDRPRGRQVQRPARGPISATGNRGTGQPARRNGHIRLNSTDLDNMRRFGMDPNNDKHVTAYAEEKRGH